MSALLSALPSVMEMTVTPHFGQITLNLTLFPPINTPEKTSAPSRVSTVRTSGSSTNKLDLSCTTSDPSQKLHGSELTSMDASRSIPPLVFHND
ncbi:hypothetical protein ATANTOWER_006277 [Ataeniobius toweri]|uniref:Uncharacterized protein n=1 Tax=Ataeniobius toweri TaxID=208326 RepID=A0ABU7BF21_9TELE|nr:hypothetical protein [Ataeniobius toweri]